ncbi:hypothetical protein WJX84_002148 [Apatococcus fuscideae]|uniref:Chorein N-terminal domain-containing protein n=1 Tax=Apatococcus fuscideae TaxID=2026836 RepID=A0AAW1TD47_9CHLO
MERLLTPIVTRLLQSYIKSAEGKTGADLRVVLSGGSLSLYSLELNLDPVLRKFPFLKVHRAYAEKLQLVIPWTSLATQPIQIWLENVEVVAEVNNDLDVPKRLPVPPAQQPAADGGWMGSLASRLLRALFNITLKLDNVVIRALHGDARLSLQCGTLRAFTPSSNWRQELKDPKGWLKKQLDIHNIMMTLERRRVRAEAEAVAPVFAILENWKVVEGSIATVKLVVKPLVAFCNIQQATWLMQSAKSLGRLAVGLKSQSSSQPAVQPAGSSLQAASVSAKPQPAAVTSLLTRTWDFITDEAAYAEAVATQNPSKAATVKRAPRPQTSIEVVSEGGLLALAGQQCLSQPGASQEEDSMPEATAMLQWEQAQGTSSLSEHSALHQLQASLRALAVRHISCSGTAYPGVYQPSDITPSLLELWAHSEAEAGTPLVKPLLHKADLPIELRALGLVGTVGVNMNPMTASWAASTNMLEEHLEQLAGQLACLQLACNSLEVTAELDVPTQPAISVAFRAVLSGAAAQLRPQQSCALADAFEVMATSTDSALIKLNLMTSMLAGDQVTEASGSLGLVTICALQKGQGQADGPLFTEMVRISPGRLKQATASPSPEWKGNTGILRVPTSGRRVIKANIEMKELLIMLCHNTAGALAQGDGSKQDERVLCSIPSAVWMLREPSHEPVPMSNGHTYSLPELHATASDMTIAIHGPGLPDGGSMLLLPLRSRLLAAYYPLVPQLSIQLEMPPAALEQQESSRAPPGHQPLAPPLEVKVQAQAADVSWLLPQSLDSPGPGLNFSDGGSVADHKAFVASASHLKAALSIWQPGKVHADLSARVNLSFMSPSTHAAEDLLVCPKLDLHLVAKSVAKQSDEFHAAAAAACPLRVARRDI